MFIYLYVSISYIYIYRLLHLCTLYNIIFHLYIYIHMFIVFYLATHTVFGEKAVGLLCEATRDQL